MGTEELGKNIKFPIYNSDGTPFHNLEIYKSSVDSVVMSLSDKISGDVYYKDNTLDVTMGEYITYNGVNYILVNPPTIVREGMASDNGELKGMTKYSFVFYHPMCLLGNFPFCDVAVTNDQTRYLGESKSFSWVGYPDDYIAKLNKNLVGTEWIVQKSPRFPQDKESEMSPVLPFANNTIADALKIWYDTWGLPYIIDVVSPTEQAYAQGKRFKVVMGLASNEIYASNEDEALGRPFVFQMGQGVGLKNNSRTPRNNKIVTRIAGCGSENNIPYGYPQIRWFGTSGLAFTYGDHAGVYNNVTIGGHTFAKVVSYPIYKGILGGAYVELINHPFTRKNLMPSVYRSCLFNKISFLNTDGTPNLNYNPDIELVDYYDAIYSEEYPYPNQINPQAPSYESHTFEDIKPELGEAQIVSATPLNKDLTPASSWDDSIDDDGNYNQSYFQIVLPQLPFDIYACAAITEEMQISMRTGACIGCTFPVQVDWDDYKRNFYDENGNFAPNGEQRDLTKYPKSNEGQIAFILQKEDSTFGTLMPNMYQYPVAGDGFVILGISLPESYITGAESNLDGEMKSYMLENNVYYFDYPLKFDEAFLATHTHILSQIRPNTIIHFKYANEDLALSVKQITVRYGESQLPKYDITLTDNVEVVLNQIGRVAEDVEKLSTLIAILRQSYGRNVWSELAKKLSKTQDDTAAGFITMLKGLQIGANFVPDILGEGGVLRMREDGKVELVTDILYARVKAYFDSVEIREYQHTGGNRIASVAGNKICRVAWFNSSNVELEQTQANLASVAYFRCYFRASDGEDTVRNNWVVGDQAYCHITSVTTSSDNPEQKGLNQKHLWRLVIGRNTEGTLTEDGEAYIDLSNRATETISGTSYTGYQSGSDIPEAQDDIIQLGNVNDTTRQGAIIEYVSGVDAPTYQIYQGLGADATNPYTLSNKNQITIGYNSATGKADMKVYGDAYIGDRNRSTFIEYKQDDGTPQHKPVFNIKAKIQTLPNSTYEGMDAEHFVQANQIKYDSAIQNLTNITNDLQSQIDGEIVSWFYEGTPTLDNAPAVDWNTDTLKERHLGDMYYDVGTGVTSGFAYRFIKSEQGVYSWQYIDDTAITLALAKAAEALGLAGSKAKTYTTANNVLPSAPYNVGDLWLNATGTWGSDANAVTWENEILKCINACPANGTPNISDWAKASKYTDDSAFNGYINAFLNGSGASGDSATAAAIQKAIAGALGSGTVVAGGLLLTSLIGMRQYNGTGDKSDITNYTTWAGISGEYNANVLGGGMAEWFGGGMLDKETLSEEQIAQGWNTLRWAKGVDRFDGSGYRANGNITWNEQGQLVIKNITTLSDSNNKNILNELATFNSAFTFGTSGQGSTTALYITPQVPFESLYIGTSNATKKEVATREWVGDNYISKAWFNNILKVHYTQNSEEKVLSPNEDFPQDATDKTLESVFSFWTNYGLTALGKGIDGTHVVGVLDDLNDVTITNPQTNQVLKYNGTQWVNAAAPSGASALSGLTDVAISSLADKDLLQWDYATGKWKNVVLSTVMSGYATTSQLANYLPLSGGTMTGILTLWGSQYNAYDTGDGALNLNNSDITGVNSILTADLSDSWKESIGFKRSNGNYDTFRAADGSFYFGVDNGTEKAYIEYSGVGEVGYFLKGSSYTMSFLIGSGFVNRGIYSNTHSSWMLYFDESNTILNYGNVGIGTTTPAYKLDVNGDARATNFRGNFVGNADSATKLQTARTIWGQSFDGTANVSGNMTDVGTVNDVANIQKGTSTAAYLHVTNITNTIDYVELHCSNLDNSRKDRPLVLQNGYGNVGIGVAQPSYKLHVNGSFNASGNSSIGGTFGVTGATTLTGLLTANGGISIDSSKTLKIGDIYLAYDSTNNAIEVYKLDGTNHVAANLYARGGISALGQGVDGGGGGVDMEVVWANLAASTSEQINASHLSTALSPYALESSIPTNVSQLNNDSGFITSAALSGYATETWVGNNYLPLSGGTMTGIPKTAYVLFKNYNDDGDAGFCGIGGTTSNTIYLRGYSGNKVRIGANDSDVIYIDTTNYVGIGVASPSCMLDVAGAINGTSVYYDGYACIHAGNIGSQSVSYASSAGSVAWGNVSGRPTALSSFTNDSGYITSSALSNYLPLNGGTMNGGIYWNETSLPRKGTVEYFVVIDAFADGGRTKWCSVSDLKTSQLTNDAGFLSSINSSMVTNALGYTPANSSSLSNYLPLSGGSLNGHLDIFPDAGSFTEGIRIHKASNGFATLTFCDTDNTDTSGTSAGTWSIASYGDRFGFSKNTSICNDGSSVLCYYNDNWGIGTISPLTKLDVRGKLRVFNSAYYREEVARFMVFDENPWGISLYNINPSSGAFNIQVKRENTDGEYMPLILNFDGANVGVGNIGVPSYKLHVVGDIYATGGVTCLSDIRKKDVTGYNLPLTVDQIAAAPTIKFTWKDKREVGEQAGTIAQYWQNVLPWVIKDKSGELSMQYGVAALISSITIARKVVNHEERIKALERENAYLKQAYSFIKNAYDYLKMDYENLKLKIA